LPLTAIIYGSLAIQARLARTAFLEVMRQDFVRLAKAKGVPKVDILVRHVGRAASITIITTTTNFPTAMTTITTMTATTTIPINTTTSAANYYVIN